MRVSSRSPVRTAGFSAGPRSPCQWAAWRPSWRPPSTDTVDTRTGRCGWPRSAECPHSGRGTSSDSGHSRCRTCEGKEELLLVRPKNTRQHWNSGLCWFLIRLTCDTTSVLGGYTFLRYCFFVDSILVCLEEKLKFLWVTSGAHPLKL